MKILKKAIFKTIFIASLIIGGGAFIIYLPKIFGTILVKSIDWLTGGVEPKYDENGRMIYDDGRHTVVSFGKRKEFDIFAYMRPAKEVGQAPTPYSCSPPPPSTRPPRRRRSCHGPLCPYRCSSRPI